MIKRILSTALFVLATSATMLSQNVALKTNALYWATTTPNLGIEASVGKKRAHPINSGERKNYA